MSHIYIYKMSDYTYERFPREKFAAYAKRKGYAIARDREFEPGINKDSKAFGSNSVHLKKMIETYEVMLRQIRQKDISIDWLHTLQRYTELREQICFIKRGNEYLPKALTAEMKECEKKIDCGIFKWYREFPHYFQEEVEKFYTEQQVRKADVKEADVKEADVKEADVKEADAKKEEMEWIQAEIKILEEKLRELRGEVV